jgi:hypothetical protein
MVRRDFVRTNFPVVKVTCDGSDGIDPGVRGWVIAFQMEAAVGVAFAEDKADRAGDDVVDDEKKASCWTSPSRKS